jgi:cobyric acid synthase
MSVELGGGFADVAATVRWLIDEDNAMVTGQVINAENGFRR